MLIVSPKIKVQTLAINKISFYKLVQVLNISTICLKQWLSGINSINLPFSNKFAFEGSNYILRKQQIDILHAMITGEVRRG